MTRRSSGKRCLRVAVALAVVTAVAAGAQEQPATFEFSFSNPGARSLALGGAFAALADDATAAFANPAGLVQLLEPELSAEARATSRQTRFVEGGRVSGEPSGEGIDTTRGLRFGVDESDTLDLPFASFVLPAKRWSIAIYHHAWADFELSSRIDGLFDEEEGETLRAGDIRARTRVEVVHTGLAAGFEVTERLSLGLGAVYYRGQLDSFAEEFAQEEEALFEPSGFAPDRLDTIYSHQADDTGVGFQSGFLWRASPSWSVGGYFRQGARLTLRVVETTGPAEDEVPPGTIELDETSPLRLPDVFGAGVAYRSPDGAWTLGFEWSRVRYSSITEGLSVDVLDPDQIVLEDGDELRLGLERVVRHGRPVVAVRLGAWLDPAHRVAPGADADAFERAVFRPGDDELHLSGGVGVAFERFQFDLGVDHAEAADLVSLSLVYRF